jgi:plasmid stabilization system protein ParE
LSAIEGAKPNRTIGRIRAAVNSMRRLGDIGRPAPIEGLRELFVRNAPYVVLYRVHATTIEVVAVYHGAQDR